MDYIAWLIHIPLLYFLIKKIKGYYCESPIKKFFYAGLGYKFAATIAIGAVYLFYYSYNTDTFWIYHSFLELCKLAWHEPEKAYNLIIHKDVFKEIPVDFKRKCFDEITNSNRTFYFFIILCPIFIFSLGNFWISCLYLSLISYWAFFALSDAIVKKYPYANDAAVTAFLFWPTVIIWSSGIFKETILMICICLPLIFILNNNINRKTLLLSAIACFAMFLIRPFYWIVFTPICMILYLLKYWSQFTSKTKVVGISIFSVLSLAFVIQIYNLNVFSPGQVIQTMLENNNLFLSIENSNTNYNGFPDLKPTLLSVIEYAPKALWVSLFEPTLLHYTNKLTLVSTICNSLLVVLALYAMYLMIKNRAFKTDGFTITITIYIVVVAVFLALSTPNFGSLERYKVGILPFFIFMVLKIICRYDKIYFNKHQ